MSRTPKLYEVALVDALQLSVAVLLPRVGPGLLLEPGLGSVGAEGAARSPSLTTRVAEALLANPAVFRNVSVTA
jgi:hypothetical protein